MWRHRAGCNHGEYQCTRQRELEPCVAEICLHLKQAHALNAPREGADYQVHRQRQCDYCLEPYVDDCTKCHRDFCQLHAGDIDGLCGGCI